MTTPLRTIRSLQLFILFFVPLLLSSARGGESIRWTSLLTNTFDIPAAGTVLSETDTDAAYFAAKALADYPAAIRILESELARTCTTPTSLLTFHRLISLTVWSSRRREIADRLTTLAFRPDCLPALRREIFALLLSWRENERNRAAVDLLVKSDGVIRHWARIVGPFDEFLPYQAGRVDSFLRSPSEDSYPSTSAVAIRVLTDTLAKDSGSLSLSAFLPEAESGAIYSTALFHSDSAREAILALPALRSSDESHAWLNRYPVYRSEIYQGYTPSWRYLGVRLTQGVNVLILKSAANTEITAALLDTDYGPLTGISPVAWNEGRSVVLPPHACHGFLAATLLPSPLLPDPLPAGSVESVSAALSRAERLEATGEVQAARSIYLALAKQYPKSSLLQSEAGLFSFRDAMHGIDARERLQKEGITFLEAALAAEPNSPRAHFMIGHYYKNHGERDLAVESLKSAVQSAPLFSQAVVELARQYSSEEQWHLAETILVRAAGESPQVRLLLLELLESNRRFTEADQLAADLRTNNEINPGQHFHYLLKRNRHAEAAEFLKQEAEWQPCDPAAVERISRWRISLSLEQGDLEGAMAEIKNSMIRRPFDPHLHLKQAEILLRRGNNEAALQHLQKAHSLQLSAGASDPDLLHRIQNLQAATWIHSEYDLSLDHETVKEINAERYPASHHANLLRVQVCRLLPDRSSISLIHNAVKIFTKNGIAELGELRLPSDPDNLLYCRTLQPDGTVSTPTNIRDLNFTNSASFSNLSPGCTVEYAFRKITQGGRDRDLREQFWFEEFDTPTIRARFVLILPPSMEEELSLTPWPLPFPPARTVRPEGIVLIWDVENPDTIQQPEPNMPAANRVLKNIHLLIRAPMYDDQLNRFQPAPVLESSDAIRELARDVTKHSSTEREKALLLHQVIRTLLQPVKGARTPRDAIALKSGGSEVAGKLFTAMLDAVGISSARALSNPAYKVHLSRSGDRNKTLDGFSTPLLRVNLKKDLPLWISFADPVRHYRPEDLGPGISQAPALVQDKDGLLQLDQIHGNLTELLPLNFSREILLNADGSADLHAEITLYGKEAGRLRTTAERPQEGPRQIRQILIQVYPQVQLTRAEIEPAEGGRTPEKLPKEREPLTLLYTGSIRQFSLRENSGLSFPAFPRPIASIQQLLAPAVRRYDYIIPRDLIHQEVIRYKAPAGWFFSALPPSLFWQGEFGLYGVSLTVVGEELNISRFLLIPAGELTPLQLPVFLRWVEACSQREQHLSITISPRPTGLPFHPVPELVSPELIDRRIFFMTKPENLAPPKPEKEAKES